MAAAHTCATAGCEKEGSMRCPNCIKLNIEEGSYFCTQECFKGSWSTHKAVHKAAKEKARMTSGPLTWPGFSFTGEMRPWPQSARRVVPEHIPRPDYAKDGIPISEQKTRGPGALRCLKPAEIEKMRYVCKLGREVLDECGRIIRPGITTDDIDRVCHEASVARDCYPSPLNYYHFPKSCCTSVNEVICHGIPDGYTLKDGDIVNVDISIYHNGYHADLNETFLVGNVDDESLHLVKTTYECLQNAIKACKPGVRYRDLGDIISKHAHAEGLSVVRTYCGHGINDLFHTAPNVPHYAKNKAVGVMKPGHTFTIEPMINLGTWRDITWPDNWTSTTKDGKRSAQFEQTLLITEEGCEILTARTASSPRGPMWFEDVVAEREKAKQNGPDAAQAKSE